MNWLRRAWKRVLDPHWDVYQAIADSRPRCDDCGRIVVVGAAANDYWRCEYCLVVADFDAT